MLKRCLMLSMILFAAAGRVFAQAPVQLVDLSKVADSKAALAVEKIGALQAKIKELKIDKLTTVHKMKMRDTLTTDSSTAFVAERRPDLYYKEEHIFGGPFEGSVRAVAVDGKTIWSMTVNGQSYVNLMVMNMQKSKRPQAEIDKWAAENKLIVTRCDLQRIKEAGDSQVYLNALKYEICPLSIIDPASLKLEKESEQAWVFTASMPKPIRGVMTMTFNKSDGMPVRTEARNGDFYTQITCDKYTINPNPPLKDSLFTYQPDPSQNVADMTERTIQSIKKESAR